MEHLLFLTQRIPYPPDKGDKIRAWQILRHLMARYRVHLGCFYDNPGDERHIEFLRGQCESACFRRLHPYRAKLKSIARLFHGEPLTLGYFDDAVLRRWVDDVMRRHRPRRVFVFCSAMAPYVRNLRADIRILDMVDVDSDKWRQYAPTKPWPLSAIYAREQRTLLTFERAIAAEFDATLLVSRAEADLFATLAPEVADRLIVMRNGIDADEFDPDRPYHNPYPPRGPVAAFTGAMDYWPNIEGVCWFARDILPLLRARHPSLEFWIVGHNPSAAVRGLAAIPGIIVTGRVDDVRPYLRHADVVVAPLRIARGVQNKVLEAMAMARPLVVSREARDGIEAVDGEEMLVATSAGAFAARIDEVLAGAHPAMGRRARERVSKNYPWCFAEIDAIMAGSSRALAVAGA